MDLRELLIPLCFALCFVHIYSAAIFSGPCYNPTVVATWRFGKLAVQAAACVLKSGGAVDAVEAGVTAVEIDNQGQYFVGFGGLPNANGIMELDAAIMDGLSTQFKTYFVCEKLVRY